MITGPAVRARNEYREQADVAGRLRLTEARLDDPVRGEPDRGERPEVAGDKRTEGEEPEEPDDAQNGVRDDLLLVGKERRAGGSAVGGGRWGRHGSIAG